MTTNGPIPESGAQGTPPPNLPPPGFYSAPPRVAPSMFGPPLPAPKPPRPLLNNTVGLAALGAILIIAAVGLAIGSATDYGGHNVVVATAGLCVLVAAIVLAYAAIRGLRPGWFLGVSIAGAVLLFPVLGFATTMVSGGFATSSVLEASVSYETSNQLDVMEMPGSVLQDLQRRDLEYGENSLVLSPDNLSQIDLVSERATLDLTGLPRGGEHWYSLRATYGSELVVFLRPGQVPNIDNLLLQGSQLTVSNLGSTDEPMRTELSGMVDGTYWIEEAMWIWNYRPESTDTWIMFEGDVLDSDITFVMVTGGPTVLNQLPGHELAPANSTDLGAPQSGAQSGAQSGMDED